MDVNFIEMEQSLRKQLKEDQKQTMNTIQSLCELSLGLFLYLKLIQIDANKGALLIIIHYFSVNAEKLIEYFRLVHVLLLER